jgi:hypothetical protein
MNRSDEPVRATITLFDRTAFASSANLAASQRTVYQQGFIPLSACHD